MTENSLWHNITLAALGHQLVFMARDEQDAGRAFERYCDALKRHDITQWEARASNGQHSIRFINGGDITFRSWRAPHLDGLRAETVVYDE